MKITKENLNKLYTEQKLDVREIAKILGINYVTVYRCLKRFGIPTFRKAPEKIWDEQEIKFLKENYEKHGAIYCSEKLNVSIQQIQYIVKVKKLYHFNKWSAEEELFLIKNYEKNGPTLCGIELNRDPKLVSWKARKLGLKKFVPKAKEGFQICSRCKEEKPIDEFGKNNRTKNGTTCYCKICIPIIKEEKRNENPFKEWSWKTICSHRYSGYEIKIKREDLEKIASKVSNCPFCNIKINWLNKEIKPDSPSLDRINNGNTLSIDNIMILCTECNTTKGKRSLKEFLDYVLFVKPNLEKLL